MASESEMVKSMAAQPPAPPRWHGSHQPRILLTGVFGPYGVDDEWGRKENVMELFHNQVTRGQGLASFRFLHLSYGLYFIADNIKAAVTVLDFPSRRRFERELQRGYDIVGISFIVPNFAKAREMARVVRRHLPRATVVLGGHGAAIEGIERLIDCDHVVKGEGIRWMRAFLGEDPDAPIRHPVLPVNQKHMIYGVSIPGNTGGILVPGVGCSNGCNFCATSHFFGKCYVPFVSDGRELYRLACRIADQLGDDALFVMDENFLKERKRALDFLAEMEREKRWLTLHVFSSADSVLDVGIDTVVRLGIHLLWMGVESFTGSTYAKNRDVDFKRLVGDLRDHGVSVLASSILCMEHHTPENIRQDIDHVIGLSPDMIQFMLYTGLPVTALYDDHRRRGLLREDLPYEEWHGQKYLNWRHPAFPDGEAERALLWAFRKDYEANSSSMYRVAETAWRGYATLTRRADRDECLEARRQQLAGRAVQYSDILPVVARYAVNELERQRARELDRAIQQEFGLPGALRRLRRQGARALAARWAARVRLFGDTLQPRTMVERYPARAALEASADSAEQPAAGLVRGASRSTQR